MINDSIINSYWDSRNALYKREINSDITNVKVQQDHFVDFCDIDYALI